MGKAETTNKTENTVKTENTEHKESRTFRRFRSPYIHAVEIAPDIFACLTPAEPMDITYAGMMDNFSNAAFINRGGGLVSDTYYDLRHAQNLKKFCHMMGGEDPKYVFNTHGHWDHYWGNQVFEGAAIIGQVDMEQDTRGDKVKKTVFGALQSSSILQWAAAGAMTKANGIKAPDGSVIPFLVKEKQNDFNLRGVRPTLPNAWFTEKTALNLDGLEVQMLHLGAIHSSSDSVVWIPSEKVLFAGDIFADCSVPANLTKAEEWIRAMDYLLDQLGAETIVPGHGIVYDRLRAENQRDYFRALVAQFKAAYTDDITLEELKKQIKVEEYLDHRPAAGWAMAVEGMFKEKRSEEKG